MCFVLENGSILSENVVGDGNCLFQSIAILLENKIQHAA
jgi:hypothetical protein